MLTRVPFRSRPDASSEDVPARADDPVVEETPRLMAAAHAVRRVFRTRPVRIASFVVAGTFLFLLALTLGERIMYRDRVLPGVEVDGTDAGGATEKTVLARTTATAQRVESQPLRATASGTELAVDPSVLGYKVDPAATTRAARRAGRSGDPVSQVFDFVLRRVRPERVSLRVSYDQNRLRGTVEGWNNQVAKGVQDGGITITGTTVNAVEPKAGTGILVVPAMRKLDDALNTAANEVVALPVGTIRPGIDRAEVDEAAARARAILSAPVTVSFGPTVVTIAPEQLAPALRVARNNKQLDLSVDTDTLRSKIGDQITPLESQSTDASFAVSGSSVSVVPSTAGRAIDFSPINAAILRGERTVTGSVTEVQPKRNTQWAQSLNINTLVSSFTTNYPCCQARVKNIQRAAGVIDGTIVEPGQTFSMNEKLGKRTAENGYVRAPVYSTDDGFFDDFGGGISQVSTTIWNATFFAGYKDIAHTPHSLWISRYPKGREATLNWGSIDNKWQNDSSCGVLMKISAGSTSVTVNYYSCKDRTVRSDEPTVLEEIPITTECTNDPTLPAGVQKETDHGYTGYRVEYFRYVAKGDGPEKKERWAWTYTMVPRKALCGTGGTPPPPATTTPGTPAPVPATPPSTPPAAAPAR